MRRKTRQHDLRRREVVIKNVCMVNKIWIPFVALVACSSPAVDGSGEAVASCVAVSAFNDGRPECREYLGEGWSLETAEAACGALKGDFRPARGCVRDGALGGCVLQEQGRPTRVVPEGDPSTCVSQQRGCEIFGGGRWTAFERCGGASADDDGDTGLPPFIQPVLECRPPLPGSPPGNSDGGAVCTWQGTQGCTEPGRRFEDYASCDVVRTQRPAAPVAVNTSRPRDDPRRADPAWRAEAEWVRDQIRSCSCVCCHSRLSPVGPMMWSLDGDAWIDTWYDSAIAAGAGAIESPGFGAYPPALNNGFRRTGLRTAPEKSVFASTDPARLERFFAGELAHRGRRPEEFASTPPFGDPIDQQRFFPVEPCRNGEGVAADGTIVWRGGRARYVYVLDEGSVWPSIPPYLDEPPATRWRIDRDPSLPAVPSGQVRYGVVGPGWRQRIPAQSAPPALEPGRAYLLYVAVDVAIPATRCRFVTPVP
ncbi:MAG: hypothetical protein SFW67_32400 [Myxococcaceae bacterium]|nr:hypothetical protein [Myxococcaceae bacterium]